MAVFWSSLKTPLKVTRRQIVTAVINLPSYTIYSQYVRLHAINIWFCEDYYLMRFLPHLKVLWTLAPWMIKLIKDKKIMRSPLETKVLSYIIIAQFRPRFYEHQVWINAFLLTFVRKRILRFSLEANWKHLTSRIWHAEAVLEWTTKSLQG